jgi:hypothetical protein
MRTFAEVSQALAVALAPPKLSSGTDEDSHSNGVITFSFL